MNFIILKLSNMEEVVGYTHQTYVELDGQFELNHPMSIVYSASTGKIYLRPFFQFSEDINIFIPKSHVIAYANADSELVAYYKEQCLAEALAKTVKEMSDADEDPVTPSLKSKLH